jgi:predicted GNAT family N-acyltransferase
VFRIATSDDDRLAAYCIRSIVFMGEQACPFREEFDGLDADCIHVLGVLDGEPVAAARIRDVDGWAKLERIAVVPRLRGRGAGHALVEFLLRTAREAGFRRFKMHAQVHLEAFYAQHGFVRDGGFFQEAGIDHVKMVRDEGG